MIFACAFSPQYGFQFNSGRSRHHIAEKEHVAVRVKNASAGHDLRQLDSRKCPGKSCRQMRIALSSAEFFKCVADKATMLDNSNAALRQPCGEVIVSTVVNAVRLKRGVLLRRVHSYHDHLRVLPEGGRILGQGKIPFHNYKFDGGLRSKKSTPGHADKMFFLFRAELCL